MNTFVSCKPEVKGNNFIQRSFYDSFNRFFKTITNEFGTHYMRMIEREQFLEKYKLFKWS